MAKTSAPSGEPQKLLKLLFQSRFLLLTGTNFLGIERVLSKSPLARSNVKSSYNCLPVPRYAVQNRSMTLAADIGLAIQ